MAYQPLKKIFYKEPEQYEKKYETRFLSESSIHFEFDVKGNPAFLMMTGEILQLCYIIVQKSAKLQVLAAKLPPIAHQQFMLKSLVDEINLTNKIEGVNSTRREIAELVQKKENAQTKKRFYGLVKKYAMLSTRETIPLATCADVRNLFDELVAEEIRKDDPKNLPDGQFFRKEEVYVYSETQKVVHYGLMPEKKVIEAMTHGLNLLQNPEVNALVKIAVFHYLFGYIHPFYDGNGRVNRFISSYMLSKELDIFSAYGLSAAIKKQLSKYYKAFSDANSEKNKGELTPFVTEFLQLVLDDVDTIEDELKRNSDKLVYFQEKIGLLKTTSDLDRSIHFVILQNTLFGFEGLSVEEIAQYTEHTITSVRYSIAKLEKEYLRVEKKGKTKLYDFNLDKLSEIKT